MLLGGGGGGGGDGRVRCDIKGGRKVRELFNTLKGVRG